MVVLARIDQRLIHGDYRKSMGAGASGEEIYGCRRHSLQQ